MKLKSTKGYKIISQWLAHKNFKPFRFQEEAWQHIINRENGLVNAPTGCGKTYSVFLGALIRFINDHPDDFIGKKNNGLQLLWVTPLRALAKDIGRAMEEAIAELGMQWRVAIRNGDTDTAERQRQKRNMPEVLIITPESLHLLLAQKDYPTVFQSLKTIAIDEWHELIGSKRGVQVELAVCRLVNCVQPATENDRPSVWGISATIGNLDEAKEVLLAPVKKEGVIVRANIDKKIKVESIIPDEIEKYPWAGHLGIRLAEKLIPIIEKSRTTLIFINTRGMSERWYQTLLDIAPQFAGAIALHHGSIEQELRLWVEDNLHTERLKAVVCTSSLDLGVDFRPVDTVVQVGSPKGVARFLQRAGRSGHRPGEISKIYFLPTHSLELLEVAALKQAIRETAIESRQPMVLCFDVLLQFLCTLAISDGFRSDEMFDEIKSTFCFSEMTRDEWNEILHHLTEGGKALQQYDEYKKVELENGVYHIKSRRIAMRHRMHIGTIVSDAMLKVKFMGGGYVGVIEEYFISRLEPGDVFTLAGKNLELVMIKDMSVLVRKSNSKKSIVPAWMGGRMSLTANLGRILRETFNKVLVDEKEIELKSLHPLFQVQQDLSHIPRGNELLIEQIEGKDGYHLLVYPFEGRQVHEAMSAILAYRISQLTPITFSISMSDYGFELLSDQPIPVDDSNARELFTTDNLLADIQRSMNSTEMARRKFRDIAVIGGLIFQGMPGEQKKARHLQSSASLLFKVFEEYDPKNILLRQAYHEVLVQQMDEQRLRNALNRISNSNIVVTFPKHLTPLSFPIVVDGLSRINLSSERLEDRVKKMQALLAES
ncbi:ligase-associated DNA damage response DEXH box helicase [Sediminibacterium roseum]|uniref:Ligase-associated DNA damage response DEXH box helicase n=1 Tax=Sediminibacterium roseum TaxID=1978412 RepID=A0ABX0A0S4_9BACT|nr:ligase-associated DNA damage response DEXH box helicase [Sediminibacterium roseum]NCI51023.1 ligase-associated DNA damage response DEXH box helicase [Sediminibacterium roseum]